MAVTNPRFPLLRLPSTAKTNVLKNMHVVDQIIFSLISNASKLLIIPQLKLYKFHCKLNIFGRVGYELYSKFGNSKWSFAQDNVLLHDDCVLYWYEVLQNVEKRNFTLQDWIRHFMTITDQRRIKSVLVTAVAEEHGFDLKTIQDCTKGFQIDSIEVEDSCSTAFERLILDGIQSDEIVLSRNPYADQQGLQKVLMRNYRRIVIYWPDLIGLNELLLMNCHTLWISSLYESPDFPMKTLNRFIKLWRKGSNEQIRTMIFVTDGEDAVRDVILNGIKHAEVAARDPRRPERDDEFHKGYSHGYDIFGKDGRKATLYIGDNYYEWKIVKFMVWQD